MADENRSRLGRGLAALIGEISETEATPQPRAGSGRGAPRRLPIEHVRPSPRNPRRSFLDEGLDELAASIRERGIIQPIVVRALKGEDRFEIVAGERRWRAAQRAALHEVPVVVLELDEREALEVAIIENVQRADLNPVEEAQGFDALIAEYGYSQADLARVIGKSRSHIANTLRLLKLPETVKPYLADGRLSAGHARALLGHPDPERIARQVVDKGLSVRDVEALMRANAELSSPRPLPDTGARAVKPGGGHAAEAPSSDADSRALEKRLGDLLGLSVSVAGRGDAGEIRIRYSRLEQLDEICRRLGLD